MHPLSRKCKLLWNFMEYYVTKNLHTILPTLWASYFECTYEEGILEDFSTPISHFSTRCCLDAGKRFMFLSWHFYDELQRNTANSGFMCMLGKKNAKRYFWAEYAPNIVVYTVTLYKKEAYMKDLRKLYNLKKLNFKAPQNGQNWNLISGMCFTMDFLMMILTEPYHCNLISAIQPV